MAMACRVARWRKQMFTTVWRGEKCWGGAGYKFHGGRWNGGGGPSAHRRRGRMVGVGVEWSVWWTISRTTCLRVGWLGMTWNEAIESQHRQVGSLAWLYGVDCGLVHGTGEWILSFQGYGEPVCAEGR